MILEKYRYFQLKKRNYCTDINQYSQSDRDLESTKQGQDRIRKAQGTRRFSYKV